MRDLIGGAARMSAGMWKEVANVVDPQPVVSPAMPDPEPERKPDAEPDKPEAAEVHAEPSSTTPPGTILVPVDSWTRVLEQLGNLHQAGQDLAEARERAAKAETEAKFLREQLADARAKKKAAPKPRPKPKATATPQPVEAIPAPASRAQLARSNVLRARRRASDWLQPRD